MARPEGGGSSIIATDGGGSSITATEGGGLSISAVTGGARLIWSLDSFDLSEAPVGVFDGVVWRACVGGRVGDGAEWGVADL